MSPLVLLLLALSAPLVLLLAFRWRRELVFALPFLVILNGVSIPIGASSLHLDQLVACLLVVPLAAQILIGARRFRHDPTVWWLAIILVLNLTASILHSPARSYSLLQCANLASVWVIYVLVLNFLDTRAEVEAFFDRSLWAALIAGVIGIVAFLLAAVGLPVGGAEVSRQAAERLAEAFGAYGTMVEPNILGSFAAAHLVLAMALWIAAAQRHETAQRHALIRWLTVVSSIALVLTFTRAAWIGAVAGLGLFVLLGGRVLSLRIRPARLLVPLGLVLAAGVVVLLLPGSAGTLLRFKVLNLINLESQTVVLRLVTYSLALQQIVEHPIIGWGTFSFASLVAQGTDFQRFENWRSLWIGNYLLLALHDTGVIGVVAWLGALWSILARGVRAARRMVGWDPSGASRTLALTMAVATLLVPFLATTGFSLGYPWLLIGLLGASCRLAAEEAPSPRPLAHLPAEEDPPLGSQPAAAT